MVLADLKNASESLIAEKEESPGLISRDYNSSTAGVSDIDSGYDPRGEVTETHRRAGFCAFGVAHEKELCGHASEDLEKGSRYSDDGMPGVACTESRSEGDQDVEDYSEYDDEFEDDAIDIGNLEFGDEYCTGHHLACVAMKYGDLDDYERTKDGAQSSDTTNGKDEENRIWHMVKECFECKTREGEASSAEGVNEL